MTSSVYRFFSAKGELLYVGMSISFLARLDSHRRLSHWWPEVVFIGVDRCADQAAARQEELRAIRNERPRYNLAGSSAVDLDLAPKPKVIRQRQKGTRRFKPAEFDELLVVKGLDPSKLAEQSRLSHVTIAKIRRGEPVTMATVRKVAEVIAATADIPAQLVEAVR